VGIAEGEVLGSSVGLALGTIDSEGVVLGRSDGEELGSTLGVLEGSPLG